MYFDRFDICQAFYLYASDYHGGQWSPEYRIFGRLHNIGFTPSPILSLDSLTANGRAIYDALVSGEMRVRQ